MHVNDIAKKTGVTAEVVRYYSRIGLLKPTVDRANRYRRFTEEDVSRLRFILRAKRLGFTLSEIAQMFRMASQRKTPCPMVRDIIRRRIRDNRIDLDELARLQRRMERALAKWTRMPDRVPDGNEICLLIESFDSHS